MYSPGNLRDTKEHELLYSGLIEGGQVEEGTWQSCRQAVVKSVIVRANYWSASYPLYGADVLGPLEILIGEPGTVHSPGSKHPLTPGVPPDLRECSSLKRASNTPIGNGCWHHPFKSRG